MDMNSRYGIQMKQNDSKKKGMLVRIISSLMFLKKDK